MSSRCTVPIKPTAGISCTCHCRQSAGFLERRSVVPVLKVLVALVLLAVVLAAVLGGALAIGWTIARLRIWTAEAKFVETQAGPTLGSEVVDA